MARNELNREDLRVLAQTFGFDDVNEFEEFVTVEQWKDNGRQLGTIVNGSEYV